MKIAKGILALVFLAVIYVVVRYFVFIGQLI